MRQMMIGLMVLWTASAQAESLHNRLLVLDAHLDTPLVMARGGFDITQRHDAAHDYAQVDLPRMIDGGLDGGFWVIYTRQGPLTTEAYRHARNGAVMRAALIRETVAALPQHFALATRADEADAIHRSGRRIVYQSIENAYPLGEDISLLQTFYDLGVRMVGPVHFANNQFADSATDPEGAQWGGLSPLGKKLVAKANRLGVILDASHASDAAFDDMVRLSATPIILSHSGAKAVFDHPRNIDDNRLRALAASGGVIHVNSLGAYLTELPAHPVRSNTLREIYREMSMIKNPSAEQTEALLARRRMLDKEHPPAMATLDDFMAHLLHILDVVGPDHVGIGADWDGGGGVVGMNDVAALPQITDRLVAEGYTDAEIANIWGGNMLRLLRAAEDYAAAAN